MREPRRWRIGSDGRSFRIEVDTGFGFRPATADQIATALERSIVDPPDPPPWSPLADLPDTAGVIPRPVPPRVRAPGASAKRGLLWRVRVGRYLVALGERLKRY